MSFNHVFKSQIKVEQEVEL